MSIENTAASASSPKTKPSLSLPDATSAGLFLTGMVIAARVEEREWEGRKYVQQVVSVTNGATVYTWKETVEGLQHPLPAAFSQVRIAVTRASTEKGQITVSGQLIAA